MPPLVPHGGAPTHWPTTATATHSHHHQHPRNDPLHMLSIPDCQDLPPYRYHQQNRSVGSGGAYYHHHHHPPPPPPLAAPAPPLNDDGNGNGNGSGDGGEDAALEAELVRRCLRRPPGQPADRHALSRVQGLRDVKRELEDAVLLPGRLPRRLRAALRGIRRPPRAFLLHGPPGTGKTLLVEAIAAAAGAALLCASPSAVLSKWSGESERAVRLLFRAARALAAGVGGGGGGGTSGGCIVFLDEVDALGASRGGGGGGGGGGDNQDALARRVLTELLVQMSRLDAEEEEEEEEEKRGEEGGKGDGGGAGNGPVWVFAATNRPEDVDPALLRRFERRLAVPLPDAEGRAAFVRAALKELDEGGRGGEGEGEGGGGEALSFADVQRLVAATAGLSGSDVRAVARRAALAPVRELAEQVRRQHEQEMGGKRRRQEEAEDDEDDGGLRLRAVRAADWEEAVAALFGRRA
jgi:SpoVK/Ycf46/Vps4 family AAA+-type ATPase